MRGKLDGGVLSELRLLGASLLLGASSHVICPSCGGGGTRERSLSLTRVDKVTLLYKCHRASCPISGSIRGTSGSSSVHCAVKPETGRLYSNPTRSLGQAWLSELRTRYALPEAYISSLGWCEEVETGRLVVHVRNSSGTIRGYETRARAGGHPKTLQYRQNDGPWVGWYAASGGNCDPSNPVIVVEDCISAAKVALAEYTAASILGSYLGVEELVEICSVGVGGVILALDRDATSKAIGFAARYSLLGNLTPLLLSKDLKYEDVDTIRSMVARLTC